MVNCLEEGLKKVSELIIGAESTRIGYMQCGYAFSESPFGSSELEWGDVMVPDEDKRRECREGLRKMSESSELMSVRFVAGRRLYGERKALESGIDEWCTNLKLGLSILNTIEVPGKALGSFDSGSGSSFGDQPAMEMVEQDVPYVEARVDTMVDAIQLYSLIHPQNKESKEKIEGVLKYGLRNQSERVRKMAQEKLGYTDRDVRRHRFWRKTI
ncbi:hypothetical protein HOD75_00160 [archaeon]|jgi:hypothetical protein|nr:hypothetical protein [Candidatus Woesearchaeota archaeon]MBT4136065.1 hypothetical protein [archaeon]MBT4241290.1 hypothetical protein [archaeon]MBT4418112.1 hypothetical protein [archaeon]